MDTIIVFIIFFASLVLSLYSGVTVIYSLLLGLVCFTLISLRRGFKLRELGKMMLKTSDKAIVMIKISMLIGAITATWRACGTVSYIVYYGIALMSAKYFILCAFLLCCAVSFLLGTSFGTAGTIGVVLMILGKSGNVDTNVVAGAIIAGAYFGDRCSPMSGSANLVAILTGTRLYTNIRNMIKSTAIPLGLAITGYAVLSLEHPLAFFGDQIESEILQSFDISSVVLLPAVATMLLAALKVDIKKSMSISILTGAVVGMLVQHQTPLDMLQYITLGYTMPETGTFANIIKGGGMYSMVNVSLIILISSAYSGLFAGTGLLVDIERFLERLSQRLGVFAATIFTSIISGSFSCNQVLTVILTQQFENKIYEKRGLSNYRLALDLENSAIVIAALIPWNIAGAVPAAILSADAGYVPYAFYLILIPLVNLFTRKMGIVEGERQPLRPITGAEAVESRRQ